MLYLARCAVREKVNDICMQITQGTWDESSLPHISPRSLADVSSYENAKDAVARFFVDVDWNEIRGYANSVPSTTQERLRRPFDVARHLADYNLAKLAIGSFMNNEPLGRKTVRAI